MKIYLASPFFTKLQKNTVEAVVAMLREKGEEVFSPMEHIVPNGETMKNVDWGRKVFNMDLEGLNNSDCVVYLNYGYTSDTGAAWECGYAYAKNIPVVVVNLCDVTSIMTAFGSKTNLEDLWELRDHFIFSLMPVRLPTCEVK